MARKLLVFIVIIFLFSLVFSPSLNANAVNFSSNQSPYIPHEPIYINGNDEFTSENGVNGGSGTNNDPYIIENWEIHASSQDGITIRNTSMYFNILNCYVHDGDIKNDGIVFINVTNGIIECNILNKNRNGVMFRTQYPGKENSDNNIISYNNISTNTNDGIHFEHTSSDHHSHNVINHNNISYNNRGIYMIMSAYNQIVTNNIISNDEEGILLDMCEGGGEFNKIHHNNFVNNGDNQAFERGGPNNIWDDGYPSGGNYWNDYNGTDNDGDGIGDTPYNIPGGNNKDRYPLMDPWGGLNLPPNKPNINGPTSGKKGQEYNYSFSSIDPDLDDVYLWIDWGDGTIEEWIGPYDSGEEEIISHTWNEKGTYIIKAKAKDIFYQESDLSKLEVTIPRNRKSTSSVLLRILNKFPLLYQFSRKFYLFI